MCAVLDCSSQRQAYAVLAASPLLFTLVCSIASRFWLVANPSTLGLHPSYWQIVEIADRQISEIILQPKAQDLKLETLQALLLYCQYSPLQPLGTDGARTRFSDGGSSVSFVRHFEFRARLKGYASSSLALLFVSARSYSCKTVYKTTPGTLRKSRKTI